jgi:hypothetical protein
MKIEEVKRKAEKIIEINLTLEEEFFSFFPSLLAFLLSYREKKRTKFEINRIKNFLVSCKEVL